MENDELYQSVHESLGTCPCRCLLLPSQGCRPIHRRGLFRAALLGQWYDQWRAVSCKKEAYISFIKWQLSSSSSPGPCSIISSILTAPHFKTTKMHSGQCSTIVHMFRWSTWKRWHVFTIRCNTNSDNSTCATASRLAAHMSVIASRTLGQ